METEMNFSDLKESEQMIYTFALTIIAVAEVCEISEEEAFAKIAPEGIGEFAAIAPLVGNLEEKLRDERAKRTDDFLKVYEAIKKEVYEDFRSE